MANSVGTKAGKRSRTRSPNYPAVNLENAVERAKRLYEADGRAGAPRDAALRHIGFASAHGQAMTVLSALMKFGLIEDRGNRIVPTDLAVDIIEFPTGHERHDVAVREAALRPAIYRELVEQHAAVARLPSDQSLKPELIADKKFNPKVVEGFIDDFRRSLEFAGLLDGNTLKLSQTSSPDGARDGLVPIVEPKSQSVDDIFTQFSQGWKEPPSKRTTMPTDAVNLQVLEADGSIRVVSVPPLSEYAFDFLKTLLETYKKAIIRAPDRKKADGKADDGKADAAK